MPTAPWERALVEGARELGLPLPAALLPPLRRYLELLGEWNQRLNLTAITDPQQVAIKHFLDSLTVLLVVELTPQVRAVDVGAGAGFPGVPLALATGAGVDLLEAAAKRCRFLALLQRELGAAGQVICARAEQLGRGEGRERYPLALARALAPLPSLLEYCLPLVAVGGRLVAMKGPEAEAELAQAGPALEALGGQLEQVRRLELPRGSGGRALVVVEKLLPTPARYPRSAVAIAKRPLGVGRSAAG